MKTASQRRRAGFTLAEMMVVIVILGLLATLVVPNVLRNLFQGQKAKVVSDIVALSSALDDFATQNAGVYPDSLEKLVEKDTNGHTYLNATKVPKDPWGEEYGYEPTSPGNPKPRVYSLGKDKSQGGEGDEADIDNFMIQNGDVK